MSDPFEHHAVGLTAPATDAQAIAPSDGTDLPVVTRAIFVGQSGNLRVVTAGGDTVVLANVLAGVIYPIRAARVLQTGTTASDLVGLS